MRHSILSVLILLVCVLTSCETEIPFNGKQKDPVLVVNCLACADSVIQVQVTASRFFLTDEDSFHIVPNATVALYVNNSLQENLVYFDQGYYKSRYRPTEGDHLKLLVSSTGYESVWSEATFPNKVSGFSIDTTISKSDTKLIIESWGYGDAAVHYDTVGTTYSTIHQFKIHFKDEPLEKNFYRLILKEIVIDNGYRTTSYQNNFDDIVFGEKNNNMDGIFTESEYDNYSVFSDDLIDGQAHTITVYSSKPYNSYFLKTDTSTVEKQVYIDLQTISESYYLYIKSLKALQIADPFMSEPVQIYTNVINGLGIVGARTNQQRQYVLAK